MSNSDWLQRWGSLDLQTKHHQIFVCGVGQKAKFTKQRWIQKMNCLLALWMMLPMYENVQDQLDEQHAISAHELRSAPRLTVGFFKHYITIGIKLTSSFSFFITTHNNSVYVQSHSCYRSKHSEFDTCSRELLVSQ